MRFSLLLLCLIGISHAAFGQDGKEAIRRQAREFERVVLIWAEQEGTPHEADAYEQMTAHRKALVALGPAAIEEVVLLLEHEHENVRRGSAIALLGIVDEHRLASQILLDKVLLRMVEDPDLKTRNNLYHVSRKLIAHLRTDDRTTDTATAPNTVR